MEIYKNIRRLRKKRKMSQEKLANLTGYKHNTAISKIENGEIDLPVSRLVPFTEALSCRISDLFK